MSSHDIQDMDMQDSNPFIFGADDKMLHEEMAEYGDIGEDSPLLAGHGRVDRNYEFNLTTRLWNVARFLCCCSSESPDFK